jgi:hypothetical protein
MQDLLLKIGLALAIIAGSCGATWFAADAHYSSQYTALKAGYEQASRDQTLHVAQTIASNAQASKEINDQAQTQIGSMAAVIGDLSKRLQQRSGTGPISLCPAATSPASAAAVSPGRTVTASPDAVAVPEKRVDQAAAIDPNILGDALETGIAALKAEILWRQYIRRTGQGH